ncbi:hypothetical protein MSIMFI_04270 [Mycobacterium simulans]|nr:hypothetical protein [Mycobacterium simulans]SON62742.1 hypothetical protein MSIMFI_04270 [Mycobacterium simulans]
MQRLRDSWDATGQELGPADVDALGWQINEQFLRSQMENGVFPH